MCQQLELMHDDTLTDWSHYVSNSSGNTTGPQDGGQAEPATNRHQKDDGTSREWDMMGAGD